MNSTVFRSVSFGGWMLTTLACAGLFLFASPASQALVARTIGLGLLAAVVSVPLGTGLAWVSLGSGWIAKTVFVATLCLLAVPVFVHVSMWDAAFGRLGWLTAEQGEVLVPLVSGWTAAVWIHGVAAAPQVTVLILLGLTSGRRVYEEQALLDTSSAGAFWYVTARRLWPLLLLSTLWTVLVCAREIAATDLYQIGTLAEQIYLGYSLGQLNAVAGWSEEAIANATTSRPIVSVGVIGWLAITAGWIIFRVTKFEWNSDQIRPWRERDIAARRTSCCGGLSLKTVIGLAMLLVLVVIPVGNLFVRSSYLVQQVDGNPMGKYSLVQLGDSLRRATLDYTSEFTWSLLIAACAASLILAVAILLVWQAVSANANRISSIKHWQGNVGSRFWKILLLGSIAAACALPGPLMGSLIAKLFTSLDWGWTDWLYNRTILAPVLASAWFCWPVVPLVVWFVFRQIAIDAREHARLEGAGQGTQLIRFGILGNWRAVAGCWLLAFAFCFGELSASQLVLPPGMDTVPRLMLGLLHAGVDEMTAAITLVMIGLIGLVVGLGWLGLRRPRRSASPIRI